VGRAKDRAIAPHDDGDVGFNLAQVGRKAVIVKHDIGDLLDVRPQSLCRRRNLRPLGVS
jgi:hypothetical protein